MFAVTPAVCYECCCSNACAAVAVVVAAAAATNMIPCRAMDLINYRTVTLAVTK